MDTVISAENLTVGYDHKGVITDINVEALRGQIICLLGPNGAGKSTILRTLAGLLAPVDGIVCINGENVKKIKKKDMAKKMSLVLTDQTAPMLTTVYSLVSTGRTPYTDFMGRLSEEDKKIIDDALEITGAAKLKKRYMSMLSDGEKQKVMIARALVQEPEVIILDEPTSHLDIKHKVEVIRLLQKLSNEKKITCILSLHDIELALKGCQTVMLVHNGKVVAQGAPEEVVKNGVIGELYDIQGAKYNELLGCVELKGKDSNDVFVAGGNSTGTNIYRVLARRGLGMTAGILHKNDAEYEAAEAICSQVVTETPFESIRCETVSMAEKLMLKSGIVIDSGFPVGSMNRANLEILKSALKNQKTLISLRSKEEFEQLLGIDAKMAIFVKGTEELVKEVQEHLQ